MTNPILKDNNPQWILVGAVIFAILVFGAGIAGGNGSGFFGPSSKAPSYHVVAEVPIRLAFLGSSWNINDIQDLKVSKETSLFPFFLGLGGGIISTGDVTVEGCIDGQCVVDELGPLSLIGQEVVATLEFKSISPGSKLLGVKVREAGVIRVSKQFTIMVG